MQCPYCSNDSKVVDKRASGNHTRRRRECLKCEKRFTTREFFDLQELSVVKSDGSRQPFDRSKILKGIQIACGKRPISAAQMEQIVDEIESEVRQTYTTEAPTEAIGELVMAKLRALDNVAYIRFASVYRNFTDISSFEKELERLKVSAKSKSVAAPKPDATPKVMLKR